MEELNNQEFLNAVSKKMDELKEIVEEYGHTDNWCHTFVGGIWSPHETEETEDGEDATKLQTVMDYMVQDEEELDQILTISSDYYHEMVRSHESAIPTSLDDTSDWTDADWMKFIGDNTAGKAN
jgi:hypothetical protein